MINYYRVRYFQHLSMFFHSLRARMENVLVYWIFNRHQKLRSMTIIGDNDWHTWRLYRFGGLKLILQTLVWSPYVSLLVIVGTELNGG